MVEVKAPVRIEATAPRLRVFLQWELATAVCGVYRRHRDYRKYSFSDGDEMPRYQVLQDKRERHPRPSTHASILISLQYSSGSRAERGRPWLHAVNKRVSEFDRAAILHEVHDLNPLREAETRRWFSTTSVQTRETAVLSETLD